MSRIDQCLGIHSAAPEFFCEPRLTVKSEIKTILILVLSGLLLTAVFPKMSQDRLAWLALVPLLWALNDAGPREAFRRGLVFGIAHFLSLLYWLVPTMVIYGHLPVVLSVSKLSVYAVPSEQGFPWRICADRISC